MFKKPLCLALAMLLALGAAGTVLAAEVDCDSVYCFSSEDFGGEEPLRGICITHLPDPGAGTVMLGTRVVRSGDILTLEQLQQLTFHPLRTESDTAATVTYLPIYENRVAPAATMTISIKGKEDLAPIAEDCALETYKNLSIDGKLKVSDPEGTALTYTLTRGPKRGEVNIRADGSFTYTPRKNKVGTDSFTYTATDAAGNVSREATVTMQVMKTTSKQQYADTIPSWLRPYLAAAQRAGLMENWQDGNVFGAEKPITGAEAAVLLQNALELPTAAVSTEDGYPEWAGSAMATMAENGIVLQNAAMTRSQVAMALYEASRMAPTAPGTAVFF